MSFRESVKQRYTTILYQPIASLIWLTIDLYKSTSYSVPNLCPKMRAKMTYLFGVQTINVQKLS